MNTNNLLLGMELRLVQSLVMAGHVSRRLKVALVSLKVLIQAILGFSLTLVRSTSRQ